MPSTLLERTNHLISENRRRIEHFRAEMAQDASGVSAIRQRVLQQMELSLQCLERQRNELLARLGAGAGGHPAH